MSQQEEQNLSPEELFDRMMEAQRKEAEAKESAKNSSGGGFTSIEHIEYLGLEKGKEIVFRPMGNPLILRSLPTDAKLSFFSKIANEKKTGYSHVIWQATEERGFLEPDPEWILMRLYKKVTESFFHKYTEEDVNGSTVAKDATGKIKNQKNYEGEYRKKHENSKIFGIVENGNKASWSTFPEKFYPKSCVLANVIDRQDSWCVENKHSKMLTKSFTRKVDVDKETQEEIVKEFAEHGIPKQLAEQIDDLAKARTGFWSDIDYIVEKTGKKDPAYKIKDVNDPYLAEALKSIVSNKPLTEEEKNYTLYDIDSLFHVTRYYTLNKNLGWLFKLCDAELGTDFYSELEECLIIEKEEYEKQKALEEKDSEDAPAEESKDSVKEEKVAEESKPKSSRSRSKKSEEVKETPSMTLEEYFPKYNSLTDEDKKDLEENFKEWNAKGTPEFKGEVLGCMDGSCKYPNSSEDTFLPENVLHCPVCGISLEEEE